jgi:hypothetical protein
MDWSWWMVVRYPAAPSPHVRDALRSAGGMTTRYPVRQRHHGRAVAGEASKRRSAAGHRSGCATWVEQISSRGPLRQLNWRARRERHR